MQVLKASRFVMANALKCKDQCTPASEPADPLINDPWESNCDGRQKRQNTRRQIPPVPLACRLLSVSKQTYEHDPRHCRHQPEAEFLKSIHSFFPLQHITASPAVNKQTVTRKQQK